MWRDLKHVILHSEGKTFLNVSYIFEDANLMEKKEQIPAVVLGDGPWKI